MIVLYLFKRVKESPGGRYMSEELDKLKRENEVLKSKLSKLENQSIQNIRSYKWADTLTQEEIDFIVEMKIVDEMIDYNSCTGDSHVNY